MKPYYQDDWVTIYNGDCLEVMKSMDNNSIDLTITSPPYNLGNLHHTGNIRHSPYTDDLPENVYQDWQIDILNEIYRVTSDSLFYNHKNRIREGISISPYRWILKSNWMIKQELVWFNRSQNFDKCRFYPMTERVYWLIKNKDTNFYNSINHHDLFDWQPEGTGNKHKRKFPLSFPLEIISCFGEENTILDPFLGSGTTLRACKDLGRKGIGIEISKEYCDIAVQRLAQEVLPI